MTPAPLHELVLGGQKSGKSRTAERRAQDWLATEGHEAVLIATATPGDAEMGGRIARHRLERATRSPRLRTVEEPRALAGAIESLSTARRLVVVDCLTLWLTQIMMPLTGLGMSDEELQVENGAVVAAVRAAPGPLVLVSNEIGFGVAPASADARRFIDILGRLHQTLGAVCDRVTLMVAGIEMPLKGGGG